MKSILKKAWRNILVTGVLSIVFGILTYVWPGATVTTLAWLFAFSVIAQGISLASAGWQGRKDEKNWWIFLLLGVVNIIAGLVCFLNPGLTAVFLVTIMGFSWLFSGALEIYAAIRLRKEIENEGWLILGGVLSVIAGIFVIANPGGGALAMVWLIAAFAIVFGIFMILLALKAKNWVVNTKDKVQEKVQSFRQ
jgi:uncharacterized membrane protein HdeD (DUF308 family)